MRVVPGALGDAALHVAVLVLDDAAHECLGGVEQVADASRADRRRTRAAARPRAGGRSRACASSGSRPGTRGRASRSPSATRRAIAVRSAASWTLRAKRMPQPVSATAMTSSWPAWMLSAWLVRARAPTWKTTGRRLPLMTWRTSFISTRPWPAVKLVTRPPASAKPSAADALECSDSGSRKRSVRAPQVGPAVGDRRLVERRPSWSRA